MYDKNVYFKYYCRILDEIDKRIVKKTKLNKKTKQFS
jgi:hypothetical protein